MLAAGTPVTVDGRAGTVFYHPGPLTGFGTLVAVRFDDESVGIFDPEDVE